MSPLQPPAHIALCSKGPELERGHLVAPGPWYLRKTKKKEEHELDKYDQLPGTCLKPPAAVVDIRKLQSLGEARKSYCPAPSRKAGLHSSCMVLPGTAEKQDTRSHLLQKMALA